MKVKMRWGKSGKSSLFEEFLRVRKRGGEEGAKQLCLGTGAQLKGKRNAQQGRHNHHHSAVRTGPEGLESADSGGVRGAKVGEAPILDWRIGRCRLGVGEEENQKMMLTLLKSPVDQDTNTRSGGEPRK
jgi:hypothetical protein